MADRERVDYEEILLKAMDIISKKQVESISFDTTIEATVTDASRASEGIYTVSTGNSEFTAYSTEAGYRENDAVMVTVPQGDYDKQKMIVGKQVDKTKTPMIYKSPLSRLINISNNLIPETTSVSYCANRDKVWDINTLDFSKSNCYENKDFIWDSGEIFQQDFSRIGLSADFATWLNEYDTIAGNYGLALEITFKCTDLEEENTFSKIVTLDSDDFFGDVYDFVIYQNQAALFDISEFADYPIVQLKLFAYQRNNFITFNGENIYEEGQNLSLIPSNIFIKNIQLSLGIPVENFENDTVAILTENSEFYSKELEEGIDRAENNQKILTARWVHKDLETGTIKVVQEGEIPAGYEVRWYHYKLGNPSPDQFAGAHWEYLNDGQDTDKIENVIFDPDVNSQTEQLKVIVVRNEGSAAEPIWRRIAASAIITFTNKTEVRSEATFVDQDALGIKVEDGSFGNYFIYNRSGRVSKSEDQVPRKLTAVFDLSESINKPDLADQVSSGDTVKWIFPSGNTMISPVTADGESLDSNEVTDYSVYYVIKPYLNRSATNNTVQLEVNKDGQDFFAFLKMNFGTAGTSGSDYTLVLNWENGENALNLSSSHSNSIEYKPSEESASTIITTPAIAGQIQISDSSKGGEFITLSDDVEFEFGWYKVALCEDHSVTPDPADELNLNIMYPVISNRYGKKKMTVDTNDDYSVPDYSLGEGTEYYRYNKIDKKFEQVINNNSIQNGEILYRKRLNNENPLKKIVFKPFDEIIPPEQPVTATQSIEIDDGKFTYNYGLNNEKAFIYQNGSYVIDPYDTYNEAQTYYYPVLSSEKIYKTEDIPLSIVADVDNPGRFVIFVKDGINTGLLLNDLFIFQVTLKGLTDHDLIARFPLAIKNGEVFSQQGTTHTNKFKVDYIEGADSVRYTTSGEVDFYNSPYQFSGRILQDREFNYFRQGYFDDENILGYWRLINVNDTSSFVPELKECIQNEHPENGFIKPTLNPPGIYFEETPLYGVQFKTINANQDLAPGISIPANTVLWTQPIYSFQDNYPSTTLNKWNGKDISTDDETGTITANGLAAGKKEFDNTFTGVVLGDWSKTDIDSSCCVSKQTGVYGFNHGAMAYALKDDGTAFFGKDGRGRIYFNGNKAQIYSAQWLQDNPKGMLLDIDDGYIKINSSINNSLASIFISPNGTSNKPYFSIKDNHGKKLIEIEDGVYYLQSSNFDIGNQIGTKIDIADGTITSYNFKLNAWEGYTVTIDGNDVSYEKGIQLNSNPGNGEFYFRVGDTQNNYIQLNENGVFEANLDNIALNTNTFNLNGWTVSEDANHNDTSHGILIQSDPISNTYIFKIGKMDQSYITFDNTNGIAIKTNKFNLSAGSDNDIITITSDNSKTSGVYNHKPLTIGQNFKVAWDGSLEASNADISGEINATTGKIGNWYIVNNLFQDTDGTTDPSVWLSPSGKSGTVHYNTYNYVLYANGNFGVTAGGTVYASSLQAYGGSLYSLNVYGTLTIGSNGAIQATGSSGDYYNLTSSGGTIGGWTITQSTLQSGNSYINKNGAAIFETSISTAKLIGYNSGAITYSDSDGYNSEIATRSWANNKFYKKSTQTYYYNPDTRMFYTSDNTYSAQFITVCI